MWATRDPSRYEEKLASWIQVGASPRGSIGLDRTARALAWLRGQDHVSPAEIRDVAHDVLRHRIMLSYEASAEGVTANEVLDRILELVAVPA